MLSKAFWGVLKSLQKKLILSIPISMVLGLVVGYFFNVAFLKELIIPFTFLMVYPMMVTIKIKELVRIGNVKLQISAQIINFLVIPFLGFGIGLLFFKDNPLAITGLLLTSLLPTSGMTISWTGFSKGNVSAAINMTIIGLILGSLLTPIYIKVLMGTEVNVSLIAVFKQIAFIVFIPLIAGYLTQWLIIKKAGIDKFEGSIKQKFPMVSTIGVLAIVFISMAMKAKSIIENPVILLYYLVPLAILYLINFIISTVLGRWLFAKKDAIALVYGTVMRNLSIALAIAMGVFGENGSDIALIIALAYIIQVQAAAWYVKLTSTFFAETPAIKRTHAN